MAYQDSIQRRALKAKDKYTMAKVLVHRVYDADARSANDIMEYKFSVIADDSSLTFVRPKPELEGVDEEDDDDNTVFSPENAIESFRLRYNVEPETAEAYATAGLERAPLYSTLFDGPSYASVEEAIAGEEELVKQYWLLWEDEQDIGDPNDVFVRYDSEIPDLRDVPESSAPRLEAIVDPENEKVLALFGYPDGARALRLDGSWEPATFEELEEWETMDLIPLDERFLPVYDAGKNFTKTDLAIYRTLSNRI